MPSPHERDEEPALEDDGSPDPQESSEQLIRRRAADIEVVERLRRVGFDPAHRFGQVLVAQLRELGAGTLITLWTAGELFPRAQRLKLSLPPPPPSWPAEAYSLLNEAATVAAPRFVSTSLSTWRPEERASVLTYFVNYTIMNAFKTLYNEFCRDERRRDIEVEFNDEIEHSRCDLGGADGLDKALDQLLIEQAQRQMNPRTRVIYRGLGEGLPQTTIANALDVTPKTVGRDIKKFQHHLREQGWTTEDGAR
jgi:DNA-directed RNA polymerase specialized sigma24 family protein